jgi:hypothetical protein
METNCPVISASISTSAPYHGYEKEKTQPQWLLELDTDGTIRHASSNPFETGDRSRSIIGSNFFEIAAALGDLTDLRRNFFGFAKSERNRETSCLRTQKGSELSEAIVILTRSYDTSWQGRKEIVMMEIRA